MASKLGIKGLRIADLQDIMLKNLENLNKDRKIDPHMRALHESLILSNKNHPDKESILTIRILSEMTKILPEFNQFLKTFEKQPENLSSLTNNFHQFINEKIQYLKSDTNNKSDTKTSGNQTRVSKAQYIYNKITQIYNLVQDKIFGNSKKQTNLDNSDFDLRNEQDYFLNELSRTQNTIDKFIDNTKSQNISSKNKPELHVNDGMVKTDS